MQGDGLSGDCLIVEQSVSARLVPFQIVSQSHVDWNEVYGTGSRQ